MNPHSRTNLHLLLALLCAVVAIPATTHGQNLRPSSPSHGDKELPELLAPAPTAGQVLISEFRFRGSVGASDEFVELYNNTNGPLDISGHTLFALTSTGVQTLRFSLPGALGSNTTVLPARAHYLIANNGTNGYSLSGYATADGTYSTGIVDASGVGLFGGTTPSASNRIDSVGFDTRDALFFEGAALTPGGGIATNGEYSFVRKTSLPAAGGLPQDTNNNANDFIFVSTSGGAHGSGQNVRTAILGAPGPENLAGPLNRTALIPASLLDPTQPMSAPPNRSRNQTPVTNGSQGTLTVRRTYTNNTGATITRLRLRIVDVTTKSSPLASSTQAELRVLNSGSDVVMVNGVPTAVEGTTVESLPAQALGGGLSSTLGRSTTAGTVINTPILAGETINIQFVLGVEARGSFRFYAIVEALTQDAPAPEPGRYQSDPARVKTNGARSSFRPLLIANSQGSKT